MSDMQSAASSGSSTLTESPSMSAAELAAVVRSQAEKIAALEHQLDWFRRQIWQLYGFDVSGVDYSQPVEVDVPWPDRSEQPR